MRWERPTQYMALDDSPIEEKDYLSRDLGDRDSTDLTFTAQIDIIVESGNRMSGWALRTFRRRGRHLMLTLLRSLIKPWLYYCSMLWFPRNQSSINRLEAVQKQFISHIRNPALQGLDFWDKLSELRVYSQERRCEGY